MFNRNALLKSLFFCIAIVGMIGVAVAQDDTMIEPLDLSTEPVILEFSTSAAGPPTIEPLADGRMTFRITSVGDVSGAFTGTITGRVSEVTSNPSPPSHAISVMFTIETDQGQIEGYYTGNLYLPEGADQSTISASGQILSVSGAYADLYLADVFVSSHVQFVDGRSVGDSGTMTIATR